MDVEDEVTEVEDEVTDMEDEDEVDDIEVVEDIKGRADVGDEEGNAGGVKYLIGDEQISRTRFLATVDIMLNSALM